MTDTQKAFSRRGFMGLAAAVAAVPALAACGGGSASKGAGGGDAIKFWDMAWGTPAYNEAAKKITEAYGPEGGKLKTSYQTIQWNNFYQTFSSAIASKTGPAVSTGGGFQAFQFEEQGQIAYADKVIDELKKNGQFDDFLPGVLDPFKSDKGYIAVPWQLDIRVAWYNKNLIEKAGTSVPKDWAGILETGKALKKIGVSGFMTGSGSGNNYGNHAMVHLMANNGGGVFNENGELDLLNDRNVEAIEFALELVSNGIIDGGAVSYTTDNLTTMWKDQKAGFGFHGLGLTNRTGVTDGSLLVADPIVGPHGEKATIVFPNNIMMYKTTPSQESSEAFLVYYMSQLKELWKQKLMSGLPVFKSITELPEFADDPNNVKIANDWQPIAKTFATRGTALNANIAVLDGGQAINKFTQTILTGKTDAKAALKAFEDGLKSTMKS